MINILKKLVKIMTIIKYIIYLGINQTIANLLFFSLIIKKQLIKTIIEDKIK